MKLRLRTFQQQFDYIYDTLHQRLSELFGQCVEATRVALHFGVNGVDRARTVKELAVDAGCSVSTMHRRLELLIGELQRRAKARGI